MSFPGKLNQLGIVSFISIPVKLKRKSDVPADGTLTFYRRDSFFSQEEFEELLQAVQLFPAAYHTVHDRASLILLKDVQGILRDSRFSPSEASKRGQENEPMEKVLKKICAHFQYVEAAVYLHDRFTDEPASYHLAARVWPWSLPPVELHKPGRGVTGWVLEHGRSLKMLDVAFYEQDRAYYQEHYPGLEWEDRIDIKREVRRCFNLGDNELCPLSYVCVPILHGGVIVGALRCRVSRTGPYHVDDEIVSIIEAVADLIADWWDHWTREQVETAASESALSVVNSLGAANRQAITHLADPEALKRIMVFLLELCRKAVPAADIVEFWLMEPENMLARVETSSPALRRKVSLEELRTPPPTNKNATPKLNAFRYALINSEVLHVERAATSAFLPPAGPSVSSFTVAPVRSKNPQGILYFAATQNVPWPRTIADAAGSAADQMGLYLFFQEQILGLRDVKEKLERSAKQQAQLFLDFQHQLRTPIVIARNSLDQLGRFDSASPEWERCFSALNASTKRAGTVANNLGFFVSLAQGKPVTAKLLPVRPEAILRKISRTSSYLYSKGALDRKISFNVCFDYPLPLPTLTGDPDLIELAVDNLLDNAVKYSYDDTSIEVRAATALYGREVYFSFRNRGLPISSSEAPHLKERGYRGAKAQLTSPEGTGVGLWAVGEMMRSMDGRLEIRPTAPDGWNEFRIYFRGYSHDEQNPDYRG